MNSMIARIALAAALGAVTRPPVKREESKCRLPDCRRLTTHNGGYCSADHCRLHRKKQKEAK